MEKDLILCVALYPVMFHESLFSYIDVNKKNTAWRRVADLVGAPGESFVLSNSVSTHYIILFCGKLARLARLGLPTS